MVMFHYYFSLEQISLNGNKKDVFQMNPISLKINVLEFDTLQPGTSQMLKLSVSNSSNNSKMVRV